jgi:hypothetical protein
MISYGMTGIGTLWDTGRFRCPYRGPIANAEYSAISGCSVVPTELDGGRGTACGHWDEECLQAELMTGFLDDGFNPLSRITIGCLDDLGYDVDYRNADSYTTDDLNPNCVCRRRTLVDMILGETHQLGLHIPDTPRRQLSDGLFNVAVSYGKEVLAKRKKSFGSLFDNLNGATAPFATIDVVTVFVVEEGNFYDVVVRPED